VGFCSRRGGATLRCRWGHAHRRRWRRLQPGWGFAHVRWAPTRVGVCSRAVVASRCRVSQGRPPATGPRGQLSPRPGCAGAGPIAVVRGRPATSRRGGVSLTLPARLRVGSCSRSA
jgi:hypothetical protein